MSNERPVDRRSYLAALGSGTALALAGCLGEPAEDGGGNGSGDGNGTDAGNETAAGNESNGGSEEQKRIVPGTAPGFKPFEFKKGGELTGFDIELMEAIVAETEYELADWKEFEFGSLIPAVTNDEIDVIAAAMTITEDRKKTIAFSDPYYEADQSVLVREGGDFSPESLDDLSGHRVGAQSDTTGEGVVESELIKPGKLDRSNYKSYGNYVLAVQDLENGNIDAIVVDKPVAQTFADQRSVKIAFTYETGEKYGFGLRQDDDARMQAINEGLAAVRENGTYEKLRNEWFSE